MNIYATPVSSQVSYDNYNKSVINGVEIHEQHWRVWGLKKSKSHAWGSINKGDVVFFYFKKYLISYATVIEKQENESIALSLWGSVNEYKAKSTWPLLIFLSNPTPCNIPFSKVNGILKYSSRFVVQSFLKLRPNFFDYIHMEHGSIDEFAKSQSVYQ